MSIQTGDYLIHYFTHNGTHLKELEQSATSLRMAQDLAESRLKAAGGLPLPVSFAIDRRVYNSLDQGK